MDFNLALRLLSSSKHCSGAAAGTRELDLFMIAEDDFEWCDEPDRWKAVLGLARRLQGNFSAVKLSYGNNGMLMQCRDLIAVRVFMEAHTGTWPVDALLAVFAKGDAAAGRAYWQGRPYLSYRYVLAEHMQGTASSLSRDPGEGGETFPKCMQDMSAYEEAIGATANEFVTGELPADRDFGFLENATEWSYPSTKPAQSGGRTVPKNEPSHCFRPVVVNLALPGVPHPDFDQARAAFQGESAVFVTAHEKEGLTLLGGREEESMEGPARFWQRRQPQIETLTIDSYTFVKRDQITAHPDRSWTDPVETSSPHRLREGSLNPGAAVSEIAAACLKHTDCR